ncbi:MAG: hypothetical protein RBQ97_06005, partial [Acholeplasma sp.]|nr:hypothetical protein [Acholeplasma sp.]
KEFKENQGLYQEIVESGLFSEEELKHPARTGEALKVSRSELTRQLEAHERKWRGLTGQAGNFTRFQSAFGETADPRVLAAEWAEQRAVLDRNCSTAKGALGQADEAARKAKGEAGAASTDLTKLGSEKKALEDLREAAAPFLEAVPGQNPKGFAKEVRGRQLRLTGEKGRLEVELPRLKALVDRLEAWRTLHGEASPAVFIEEFIRAREALRDEKGAAERSLELLRADIQMLRKHKVAPGEVAAKALHIARECGKAATLHEFLDGLGLDQGRRADMLSLFSPILFAPVVADAAGAEPLLLRFDEERLPVPVFLEKELAEFSRTGVVATAEAGGIVHTFLAGRRSLTVECILDPEKLKRELDAAKAREKELQERFADLNRRHAAMGDSNADLKEARAVLAAQEDGALEKYNALAMRQEAMDAELSEISEKYPEMVLKAAERAEDLDAKGGLGRLRELDVLLDAAVERVKKAELHLKECEEKWKAAGESHEAAREALRQFELKISEFREVLKELIAFVEAGGPAFMARAEEISDALKNELKALGDKIGSFKFDRAQAYLDSLDKSEEESRLLLDRKIGEAGEMEKFLRALGDEERRLEADRQTALRKATSYDSHIAAILPSYKALAGLLEDKRVQEDLRRIEAATGVSFAPAPEIREILGRILAGLEDLDAHGDEILADLAAIRARLTEEQNLKGLVDRVEEGRAGLGQADRRYQDSCEQFFKNLPAAITVEAKAEIQERTRNPERLQEYVETKNKRFEEEAERCRKAREHEEELFEVAKKNLSQLAVNGKIALQTLKSVLGHHKNATFELEVHVVDDIEAVMSKLVYEVKRVQLQLDSEFGQDLFGTDPDEVDARKTLLQRISAELYRGLFPDPRIRVYFPQIRGEKKEVYSDKFSSGEKMALSLLWLSILAEFSMRQAETTYSDRIRPGKHEQGPSIFWIDGLFSHLSDVDIIKATMQLRASQGSFQLVGLMHNPANIPSHDFGTFPRLFVTRVQKSRAMATSKDWAVTEQFKEGQVDTILAFLDKGVLPAAEGNA